MPLWPAGTTTRRREGSAVKQSGFIEHHSRFRTAAANYQHTRKKSSPYQSVAHFEVRRARRQFLDDAVNYKELLGNHLVVAAGNGIKYQNDLDLVIARYKSTKAVIWQLSRISQADNPGGEIEVEQYIQVWLDFRISEIARDINSADHRPSPSVRGARVASNSALAAVGLAIHARSAKDDQLYGLALSSLKPLN